jgi:DNA-binding transcriptional ArsR family regulator
MTVKTLKHPSKTKTAISVTEAVSALSALAQETRLSLFRYLVTAGDAVPAGQIAEALGVPAPTLSFHLKELERAGLITSKRESRLIRYCANYSGMRDLIEFLTLDCCRGHPEVCGSGIPSTTAPACAKTGC